MKSREICITHITTNNELAHFIAGCLGVQRSLYVRGQWFNSHAWYFYFICCFIFCICISYFL